jgi:hypothetical protein
MKILRYGIAITVCMLLSACDDSFDGQINLQQPITLKMKKDAPLVLPMGTLGARVKASGDKLKLQVNIGGKTQEVSFKAPKGTKIKSFNDVNLPAEANGQPYNLRGSENTDYNDSEPVRSTESCSFNTMVRDCGYETTPRICHNQQSCGLMPDGTRQCHDVPVCSGGDTQYVCHDRTITHYGSQDVEYYMSYSTTTRRVDIIDPASQQVVGNFLNTSRDSNKHYLHQGQCLEGAGTGWRP